MWHIRAPVVVAGSGETFSGWWCGRTQCRFVCVAFPVVVEDTALPAFPSRLSSGVAAALLGRQRSGQANFESQPHEAEGPRAWSITYLDCTQTGMSVFVLVFLTPLTVLWRYDLPGCETCLLSKLCCLFCCLLFFILLHVLWEGSRKTPLIFSHGK